MKIAIVGLGSMGKRRIRNLVHLGERDLVGFDIREDRVREVLSLGHQAREFTADESLRNFDAVVVSTSPAHHVSVLERAVRSKVPVFVEASVTLDGLAQLRGMAKELGVLVCPSCTLRFHPAIKEIKSLVRSGKLGRPTNFVYHCGQYLPDWHPWEDIRDFYVSKKETGAAREIVAFELTWMTDVFGTVNDSCCIFGKTIDLGVDVDDTYSFSARFGTGTIGSVTIDVTSRVATRRLTLNLEQGQLNWDWNKALIDIQAVELGRSESITFSMADAAPGYNKNITESMYVDEMRSFIHAVHGLSAFPNTLEDDIDVLQTLLRLEGDRP